MEDFGRILRVIMTVAFCSTLVACSNTPDGVADAKLIADNDAINPRLFMVADLVRENGWQESNYYKIRFNYNLVPQGTYQQVWAEAIKNSLNKPEFKGKTSNVVRKDTNLSDFLESVLVIRYKDITERVFRFPEVAEAYRSHGANFEGDKFVPMLLVLDTDDSFVKLGYTDKIQAGQKIARTVTISYIKTEKGWTKTQ